MSEAVAHVRNLEINVATASPGARPIARTGLAVPTCEPGIGQVIASPATPGLIHGVQVVPFTPWPDDRGYFLEVMRAGCGLVSTFPLATTQVSATASYPGTIKAFHYHLHQTDCWVPAMGAIQVVLVDLRPSSPTFGQRNTLYVGVLRPWQITIPPGVGHGYKAIGHEPSLLIYVTSRFYDPADEGRIPYNDPGINYDWTVQYK